MEKVFILWNISIFNLFITCDLGSDTQGTILLWMESGGFKECKITALSPRSLSFEVWKRKINNSIFGDSELKGKSNWGNKVFNGLS